MAHQQHEQHEYQSTQQEQTRPSQPMLARGRDTSFDLNHNQNQTLDQLELFDNLNNFNGTALNRQDQPVPPHSAPIDSKHRRFDLGMGPDDSTTAPRRAESVSLPVNPQLIKEAGARLRMISEEFEKRFIARNKRSSWSPCFRRQLRASNQQNEPSSYQPPILTQN